MNRAETECFSALALRSPLPVTYCLPAMNGPSSLSAETPANGLAGIVVLGSATSVHDAPPWQRELERWLLEQTSDGVPTLAICYGHQLVAHALGGRVRFRTPARDKRAGLAPVTFQACRLFDGRPTQGMLFFSHREIVEHVGRGLHAVASGAEPGIEAMEHESWPLWTVQAHPEATVDFTARHGAPAGEAELAFGKALVDRFLAKVPGAKPAR